MPPAVVGAALLASLTVYVEIGCVFALADAECCGRRIHDSHLGCDVDGGHRQGYGYWDFYRLFRAISLTEDLLLERLFVNNSVSVSLETFRFLKLVESDFVPREIVL